MKTAMKIGLLVLLVAAITGCPAVGSAITSPAKTIKYIDGNTIEVVVEGNVNFYTMENGVEVPFTSVTSRGAMEAVFQSVLFEGVTSANAVQVTVDNTTNVTRTIMTLELLTTSDSDATGANSADNNLYDNGTEAFTIAMGGDPSADDDGNKPVELYARSIANYDVKIPIFSNKATTVEDGWGPVQTTIDDFSRSADGINTETTVLVFDEPVRLIKADYTSIENDISTVIVDSADYIGSDPWEIIADDNNSSSEVITFSGTTATFQIANADTTPPITTAADADTEIIFTVAGIAGLDDGEVYTLDIPIGYYIEDEHGNPAETNASYAAAVNIPGTPVAREDSLIMIRREVPSTGRAPLVVTGTNTTFPLTISTLGSTNVADFENVVLGTIQFDEAIEIVDATATEADSQLTITGSASGVTNVEVTLSEIGPGLVQLTTTDVVGTIAATETVIIAIADLSGCITSAFPDTGVAVASGALGFGTVTLTAP